MLLKFILWKAGVFFMCVFYSPGLSKTFTQQAKDGLLTAYKVYNTVPGERTLYSPFMANNVGGKIVDGGILTSSRIDTKITEQESRSGELYVGLHVFMIKFQAQDFAKELGKTCVVVPVRCKTIDLVGVGFTTWNEKQRYLCGVMRKIELLQKDFDGVFPEKPTVKSIWGEIAIEVSAVSKDLDEFERMHFGLK